MDEYLFSDASFEIIDSYFIDSYEQAENLVEEIYIDDYDLAVSDILYQESDYPAGKIIV